MISIAVMSFAVITVAWMLGSAFWILDLFAHFKVHYICGGVVLGLTSFVMRRRSLGFVATLLIGINSFSVAGALSSTSNGALEAADLRIFSHNMNWKQDDATYAFQQASDSFSDVIVILENTELWSQAAGKILNDYPFVYTAPTRQTGTQKPHGIKIFSKTPLEGVHRLTSEEAHRRTFGVRFQVRRQSRLITIYALHLMKQLNVRERNMRQNEIDVLKRSLSEEDNRTPMVVIGDFNATPYAQSFREIFPSSSALRRSTGWPPATWPAILGPFGIPIDHVMVNSQLIVQAMLGESAGSDHRAIIADISWRDQANP